MRFVCVVNPVSGRGGSLALAETLESLLRERGCEVMRILTSPDPGIFAQRCASIAEEDRVICIGGDGTLLYFLNAATSFHSVAFYGMGTANVISIEFDLPRDPEAFVAMLQAGHTRTIRPGILHNGTRFLMMASLGLDGQLLSTVSQRLKNRLGKLAFVPEMIKAFFTYRFPPIEVRYEDGSSETFYFLSISRFKHYGGPYVLAKNANPETDTFQLMGISKKGWMPMFRALWGLWRNDPLKKGQMVSRSAREVSIYSDAPVQVDGDFLAGGIQGAKVSQETFALITLK